ncbi:hypothetical protein D3C77_494630 [compost metagenome]
MSQVEIFLIPGQMAVVQYHVQPDNASAVTVPVGYLTVEKERIIAIETYLDDLLKHRGKAELAWSDSTRNVDKLMGECRSQFCQASRRPLLSLNKNKGDDDQAPDIVSQLNN